MINKVYSVKYEDFIVSKEADRHYLKSGLVVRRNQLMHTKIKVECSICGNLSKELVYGWRYFKVKYDCRLCSLVGDRNPFYGKKHSEESKNKISKANTGHKSRTGGKCNYDLWLERYGKDEADRRQINCLLRLSEASSGEKNPMYGIKMKKEWVEKSSISRKKWRESLTTEDKLAISKSLSESQRKLYKDDPEKYKDLRRKAGKAAARSQIKYKMNKVESEVEKELIKRGLNFKYSVILGHKQFDFGSKEDRILLEVQGDYWHGNPKIYTELNPIQRKNADRDKLKSQFALQNNLELFCIWEQDIKNGNFYVLDEILSLINSRRKT